jgi:mRNA interferase MazF
MNPLRGQVWLINLDPTLGSEIQKSRPCVIVSNDVMQSLPLKIIVPVTDWKEKYKENDWMVYLCPTRTNGLEKDFAADTFQARSVSQMRFVHKLGELNSVELRKISDSLKISLDLEE